MECSLHTLGALQYSTAMSALLPTFNAMQMDNHEGDRKRRRRRRGSRREKKKKEEQEEEEQVEE